MKKAGFSLRMLVLMVALLLSWSSAIAATDSFYQLSAVPASWEGTDASRTKVTSVDYDYTYGDESVVTYSLPWPVKFYGQSYSAIVADTNGNIWFASNKSAHSFNLTNTGHGPVIAVMNNDLSSYYYGGVFIQHKTNPERIVIEWQTETYFNEGSESKSNFEAVLYPNGVIRVDYKYLDPTFTQDFGSGISRDNGANYLAIPTQVGNAEAQYARSFNITPPSIPEVIFDRTTNPSNQSTQTISGTYTGATVTVTVDSTAKVGQVTYLPDGTWRCTISDIPDGLTVVYVTTTDETGKTTVRTKQLSVDATPPAIQILSPKGYINTRTPQLDFTVSDGSVSVMVDGQTVNKLSGDYLELLAEGDHTLSIEAVDTVGNRLTNQVSFSVDTKAPRLPFVAPQLSASGHALFIQSDGILWSWGNNEKGQAGFTDDVLTWAPQAALVDNQWTKIAAGGEHTLAIRADGTLWSWGGDVWGQLGYEVEPVPDKEPMQYLPGRVGAESDRWLTIAAGTKHSAAIKNDGTLWTWGYNSHGQLGDPALQPLPNGIYYQSSTTPVNIGSVDDRWIAVAAGESHTLAIKADGTLWGWGWNKYGQVGSQDTSVVSTYEGYVYDHPVLIGSPDDRWIAVTAGDSHSLAIKADGTLWAWGRNESGQVGNTVEPPLYASYYPSMAPYIDHPVLVGQVTDTWQSVTAGQGHTLAVKSDGTLWAWGLNASGQLGIGSLANKNEPVRVGAATEKWFAVTVGNKVSLGIKDDGSVWAWGTNDAGVLGVGDLTIPNRLSPGKILASEYTLNNKIRINGNTEVTGSEVVILNVSISDASGIAEMQFSNDGTNWSTPEPYAVTKSWQLSTGYGTKTVYSRFKDNAGNWSDSFTTSIDYGDFPVVVVTSPVNGSFMNTSSTTLSFTVSRGTPVVKADGVVVAKQSGDTLGPFDDGIHTVSLEVVEGQYTISEAVTFTVDTTPPAKASTSKEMLDVSFHALLVKPDGSLWGWGDNSSGKVGVPISSGEYSVYGPRSIGADSDWKQISTGGNHSLALKKDGSLWSWGENSANELGYPTDNNEPRDVPSPVGALGITWLKVVGGNYHSLAIKSDGTLWAWGYNVLGQLGVSSWISSSQEMLRVGAETDRWIDVSAGYFHTLAIKSDGTLWAWGDNTDGQVDGSPNEYQNQPVQVGDPNDRWTAVAAGEYHSLAIKSDGTLWGWGDSRYVGNDVDTPYYSGTPYYNTYFNHPVLVGSITDRWKSITTSYEHSMGIKADGTLWAWGYNGYGEIGNGTYDDQPTPLLVGNATQKWIAAAAGYDVSLALRDDGTLWGWGDNYSGTVGIGDSSVEEILTPMQLQIQVPVDSLSNNGLLINNGASTTNSQTVILKLSLYDQNTLVEMQFSNDGTNWTTPEPYAQTKNWMLSNGNGDKTVYARVKDAAGNWSEIVTASIYCDVIATPPGIPTGVTAVVGNGQATVSFAPPASNGGSPITFYTVTSTPDNISATGTTSPITVTGLTNGVAYTFTVTATNAVGTSPASTGSNSVTPQVPDTAPPVTTASPAGGLFNSIQHVTLSCSEGIGSGCADTYYCLGAGCSPGNVYSAAITVDATTDLTFYSKDRAGNPETFNLVHFEIDTVSPALTVNPVTSPTKLASQVLSGTVEAVATVTVTANTSATVGAVTYDQTATNWQCVVSNLALNNNVFTISATDRAGNITTLPQVIIDYKPGIDAALLQSSITADYQGTVGITITDLVAGNGDVQIEQLVDANRNGTADTGDSVIRSFVVADGTASTNANVPGDNDATVNGTVATTLNYYLVSDLYHAPGEYLFRITQGADTKVIPFSVTAVNQQQTISGAITDGTAPVPGTMVRILDKYDHTIGYVVADDVGHYTAQIDVPGDYLLTPYAYGKTAATGTQQPVTVASSEQVVGIDLTLTTGAYHLTGSVKDQATGTGIAGVWVTATDVGATAVAITDQSGVYDLLLPAGSYTVGIANNPTMPAAFAKGYAISASQAATINLTADTTVSDILLAKCDQVITGVLSESLGNPLPGLVIQGKLPKTNDVNEPAVYAVSGANGFYALPLFAGDHWDIALHDLTAQQAGYLGTALRGYSTTSGQASDNNLTLYPITAWVQGVVKDSNNNLIAGVDIQLKNADASLVILLQTASDGTYKLGAFAGSWLVDALTENKGQHAVPEQSVTLADGQSVAADFIVDVTPPPVTIDPVTSPTNNNTQTITGTMESGSTVSVSVNTTATVGEVTYLTATTWSCAITGLVEGTNTITVTANDSADNFTIIPSEIRYTALVGPDLIVTAVSSATSVGTGQSLDVTVTIKNQGLGNSASFGLDTYLSADDVITTSDTLVKAVSWISGLAAGESRTITLTGPASSYAGTYYVGAIVDPTNGLVETDDTNNAQVGNLVVANGPDLIITSVSSATSVGTGQSLDVTVTIKNQGPGNSASFGLATYLSADNVITTSDTLVKAVSWISGLAAGESRTITLTGPASSYAGTYYVGAIVDPTNGLVETDDTNNAQVGNLVVANGPDLIVTAVSSATSVGTGQSLDVTVTIKNQGPGNSASFGLATYLSADNVITTSDTLVKAVSWISGLAAGESRTITLTGPASSYAGTYYVGAIVDPTNGLVETDDTNNAQAGNQVVVSPP